MLFPEGTKVRLLPGLCGLQYAWTEEGTVEVSAIPIDQELKGEVVKTIHARHLQPPEKATVVILMKGLGPASEVIFLDAAVQGRIVEV